MLSVPVSIISATFPVSIISNISCLLPLADWITSCSCWHHLSLTSSPQQWQHLLAAVAESSLQFSQYLSSLHLAGPSEMLAPHLRGLGPSPVPHISDVISSMTFPPAQRHQNRCEAPPLWGLQFQLGGDLSSMLLSFNKSTLLLMFPQPSGAAASYSTS